MFRLLFGGILLFVLIVDTVSAAPPRLLPLGDSITEGYPAPFYFSYRGTLQRLLGMGAYDFVGPFRNGVGDGDYDHSAVSGQETPQILNRLRQNLTNELADAPSGSVVLIHAGTNDVLNGNSIESTIANIRAMVDAIVQHDAQIGIYVSTIIPIDGPANARAQELNSEIRSYVASAHIPQLYLVDQYAAFVSQPDWQTTLMVDGVHPNAKGYDVMAETFAAAMNATALQNTSMQNSSSENLGTLPRTCTGPIPLFVQNPALIPVGEERLHVRCDRLPWQFRTGNKQTYTYATAYATTDGQNFTQAISLQGIRDTTGKWIIGTAVGTLPPAVTARSNIVAVYQCERQGMQWRCGCTDDGRCSDAAKGIFYWYIRSITP